MKQSANIHKEYCVRQYMLNRYNLSAGEGGGGQIDAHFYHAWGECFFKTDLSWQKLSSTHFLEVKGELEI